MAFLAKLSHLNVTSKPQPAASCHSVERMKSRMITVIMLGAVLATLVFAGPRTGKNCLFVVNAAVGNPQLSGDKDAAVPFARAHYERSGLSTDAVGNVTAKVSELFDEEMVQFHFNQSNIANSDMLGSLRNLTVICEVSGECVAYRAQSQTFPRIWGVI